MKLYCNTLGIKFGAFILYVIVLFTAPAPVHAGGELPPQWPWKAINISFPNGTANDLVRLKNNLNVTMVRFHVHVNQYAKVNHVSGREALEKGIAWLDEMLDVCAALGIASVISYDQFPLADNNGNSLVKMTSNEFWSSGEYLDEVLSVTERLVQHFKVRGNELVAYQIISEPLVIIDGVSRSPSQWPDLLARIVDVIEEIDPHRWKVVTPGPGGDPRGYKNFSPLHSKKIIYDAHFYLPHSFTHQGIDNRPIGKSYPGWVGFDYWNECKLKDSLKYLRRFQQNNDALVFIGAFSAVRWASGSEDYIKDLVGLIDGYGWGWAYFGATDWHGWNPDYNTYYPGQEVGAWRENYVGEQSVRWQTLREIFDEVQGAKH